jgi:hypothetical protein
MALNSPINLLKRVDFPTFGLPTIATILPIVFLIEPAKVRKKNVFGCWSLVFGGESLAVSL